MRPDGCFCLKSLSPWRSLPVSKPRDSKSSCRHWQSLPATELLGWWAPPLHCCLSLWISDGVVCRIGGAHTCSTVAAPQNPPGRPSYLFCVTGSVTVMEVSLPWTRVRDSREGMPHSVQGHCRQTHQEMCAGGAWQGQVCTAFVSKSLLGKRDALGEIFLLGLS